MLFSGNMTKNKTGKGNSENTAMFLEQISERAQQQSVPVQPPNDNGCIFRRYQHH